ncbi:uncharacterized protein [Palaemon carinicauda]|uniref:uncharacterized protein n=1 Tax=Palaemon carinicauda TaxID=392227 RepID=UPI0035B5BB6D
MPGLKTKHDDIVRVIECHKVGLKTKEISEQTGILPRTIRRLFAKFKSGGSQDVPTHSKPPGARYKLSNHSVTLLKRQAQANPTLKARKLRENNIEVLGKVTVRTIWNTLNKRLGFKNVSAPKKPSHTESQVLQRDRFYREHIEWSLDEWKRVLFIDESMFSVSAGHPNPVWRSPRMNKFDKNS